MTSAHPTFRQTLFRAYGVGAIGLFLIIALSLHGSSLGMWDTHLARSKRAEGHILLGEPRGIRSDEWLVSTPMMMAYVEHRASGLPTTPDYAGPSGAELLMNQPTSHFSTIFRPQFWGFFLFNTDRGFSFFWGAKVVGLALAFFTVLLLLTESAVISAAGTTWFFLSNFVQWWFSTSLPEMITSCVFATIGAWLVVSHSSWRVALLGSIALLVGSINFILVLYPPFMVVTAHACFAIFCALCIRHGIVRGKTLLMRIALLAGAAAGILGVVGLVWLEVRPIIEIVQNTVYPGRRIATSGTFPSFRYLTNFVDTFFAEGRVPSVLGNVCEASGFILIWPVAVLALLPLLASKRVEKRELYSFLPLFATLLLHTAWMSFSVPNWFGTRFGLHLVPSPRAALGAGILNVVVLSMVTAASFSQSQPLRRIVLTSLTVIILASALSWSIQKALPSFLSFQEISLVSIAIGSASIALFVRQPLMFWLPILFLVTPNVLVNPVASGTAPLIEHPLLELAKKVRSKDPHARWAVYSGGINANLLKTSGVRVFNGVSYAPRIDDYKILDPEQKYVQVFNRYANVALESSPPGESPSFQLVQQDTIIAKIHPCDPAFERIGVRYFVFNYKPQPHEAACLKKVRSGAVGGQFYVYQGANGENKPSDLQNVTQSGLLNQY